MCTGGLARVLRALLVLGLAVWASVAGAASLKLVFVGGVVPGTTTACTASSAACLYRNVVVDQATGAALAASNPYQRDVIVRQTALVNATLTAFDDDTTATAGNNPQFFAPIVSRLNQNNSTQRDGYARFNFTFYVAGTTGLTVPTTTRALDGGIFVSALDVDANGTGSALALNEFVTLFSPTQEVAGTGLGSVTPVLPSTGTRTYRNTSNAVGNGISADNAFKVSLYQASPVSFDYVIGSTYVGSSANPTCNSNTTSCNRLGAISFDRLDALPLVAVVDTYKSVRLSTDADGSGTVTPGDTLTYTLTSVNTGNLAVNDFQITDALPTGVALAPGGQTVSVGTGSTAARNAAYTGAGTSTTLLAAGASLGVGSTITVSLPVVVGLGAENTTPGNQASASGTGLAAALSDNVDNTTAFPPSVTASTGWTAPPAGSRPQTQTAALSPTTAVVGMGARLSVSKAVDQAVVRYQPAPSATTLRYTLTVTNTSGLTATTVQVTDRLPDSLPHAPGGNGSTAPTTVNGQTLIWDLGTLAPNASRQIVVYVGVPVASSLEAAAGQAQAPIVNTASAAAGNAPAASGSVTVNTMYTRLFKQVRNLGPAGTLTPAWAGSVSGRPGDVLEYCIDFANLGSTTLANYRVNDVVPASTQFVPGSASVRQGRMDAPGAAYPGATVTAAATTDAAGQPTQLLQTNALTLAPGTQGTLCFRASIR